MDSLSQIVLGAAVGEIMLGKRIGNRGQLIGAIAGTIPDLDILLNPFFADEITKLQIHRGYSHSMFVHLLMAIPFAWICHIIFKKKHTFKLWYITWYLCFLTHTLLDCCTTYGTQLLLPFTNYLVGFNNIAVVDPFWTLPFMLILIVCLFIKRDQPSRLKWAWISVVYAGLYMSYTLVNKYNVHEHLSQELKNQNIEADKLSTTPSMFNNWLWSGIATTQDSIYLCEYSVLQDNPKVQWVSFARNLDLLRSHPAQREVKVLEWFGQDKYFVQQSEAELHFFIVKWGRTDYEKTDAHDAFWFYWKIIPENQGFQSFPYQPAFTSTEFNEAWGKLWHRVRTSEPYTIN